MRFGLFGSAQAQRPAAGAELTDSSQGFREWIENNVEAEGSAFTAPLSSSTISLARQHPPLRPRDHAGLREAPAEPTLMPMGARGGVL